MPEALARSILALSGVITLLVVLASVAGLVDARVYAQDWAIQARGQDLGNLLAVVVLAVEVLRYVSGSRRAWHPRMRSTNPWAASWQQLWTAI